MKVRINKDLCAGCELCADICPDIFEVIDNVARVKKEEIPEEYQDCVKEAVEICPVEAIKIDEMEIVEGNLSPDFYEYRVWDDPYFEQPMDSDEGAPEGYYDDEDDEYEEE